MTKLSKAQQREALRMKFGGKCAYCGCDLTEKGWHADHVEPVWREWWKTKEWKERNAIIYEYDHAAKITIPRPAKAEELIAKFERPQNDTIDNLFPSCRACNIDKHATPLELWRKQMQDRVGVCRRNYSAFRHAERFGLVQEIKIPVVFWFEKFDGRAALKDTP
jgi:5-methylcytosine-specific restriction endonuclease McrA